MSNLDLNVELGIVLQRCGDVGYPTTGLFCLLF